MRSSGSGTCGSRVVRLVGSTRILYHRCTLRIANSASRGRTMTATVLLLLSLLCQTQSQPAGLTPLKIGDPAPAMQVAAWIPRQPPALPGPQVEGREAIFVVHFWAAHDGASRHNMPYLAQMHADLAKRHVVIIALSNEDAEELG